LRIRGREWWSVLNIGDGISGHNRIDAMPWRLIPQVILTIFPTTIYYQDTIGWSV
jgi:hypothetical protein